MSDWRLSQQQREAQNKRAELDRVDAAIVNTERMLEEAGGFDSEYRERVAAIRARLFEIGPRFSPQDGQPTRKMSAADQAEYAALEAQLAAVEREQAEAVDARTVRSTDGAGLGTSWSPLRVTDVAHRLGRLRRVRAAVANELAELEGQLSAGELVETGQEAPDLVEHRERVSAARERAGVGA